MRSLRTLAVLLLLLVASGCRDLVAMDGTRFSDNHILAGRSPAFITAPERPFGDEFRRPIWEGAFISPSSALLPLQSWMRASLGGSFSLRSTREDRGLLPDAEGMVLLLDLLDPRAARVVSAPSTLGGDPFIRLETDRLRDEYRGLCEDAFLSSLAPPVGPTSDPCNPMSLPGADLFVEDLIFTPRWSEVSLRWDAPSQILNALSDVRAINPSTAVTNDDTCGPREGCDFGFTCPDATTAGTPCAWAVVPCATNLDCSDVPNRPPEIRDMFLRAATPGFFGAAATCGGAPGSVCVSSADCDAGQTCACPRGDAGCATLRCLSSCTQRVLTWLRSDQNLTSPVLRADLTIDVETDSQEFVDVIIGAVNVHRINAEVRFQPVVGAARGTPSRIPEGPPGLAAAYRGASPAGDAVPYPAALDVHVRGDTHGVNVEIIPGFVGLLVCALNLDPACVFLTHELARLTEVGLQRGVRGIGSMFDRMAGAPSLLVPARPASVYARVICDYLTSGPGSCPLTPPAQAALITSSNIDLGASTVDVPFSRTAVVLGAPGGVFTRTTTLALASGGTLSRMAFDFSSVGQACGTPACAIPVPTDPRCAVCAECAALSGPPPAVCNFATLALLTLAQPTAPPRDRLPLRLLAIELPASPTYAAIADFAPNLVLELHGVFAGPLAEAALRDGSRYEYTSASFAGGSAEFRFVGPGPDRDGDGVPDATDVCPDTPDPTQPDADRDGIGDACDDCPCVSSPIRTDINGDGVPDPCDCDMDSDGCNNQIAVDTSIPGCGTATACESTGERRFDCTGGACVLVEEAFDQVPRGCDERNRDGSCANTDALLPGGDPFIDDCDLDDDADGVDDDGAGDGFDVYTPCPDGVTTDCDDNCENDPNLDQFDTDADGSGDRCDFFDDGSAPPPDPFFEPSGIGGAGFSPGFGLACIRDGRGCFAWLIFGCEAGTGTACGEEFDYVELYARRGDRIGRFDAADYVGSAKWGGAFATLPDVDGDGVEEIALGAPSAESLGEGGAVLREAGTVVALGSRDFAELWRLSGTDGRDGFGSALVRAGALLVVGAPRARNPTGVRTGSASRVELFGLPFVRSAFFGDAAGERFGAAIAPVGDPSEPGRLLGLLVGAPGSDVAARNAGRIYLSTPAGALVGVIEGPDRGALLGARIASILPNAFKDARPGILAGAPDARGGRGLVLFYDLAGRELWRVQGARGERLGESLTFGADFDGDGFEEALVGGPGADAGAGRAYIVNSSGFLQIFIPGSPGASLGAGLLAPGDLDLDGFPDLLLARPGMNLPGETRLGLWTILSGAGGQDPNSDVVTPP